MPFLPVLRTRPLYPAEWCYEEDEAADAGITPPKNRGYITMVEWPIRPGHTRIEAYFIGMVFRRRVAVPFGTATFYHRNPSRLMSLRASGKT